MKTLYNTVQQCESILDPDQNKVMGRMTDDMIRQRIRDYCDGDYLKYGRMESWPASHPLMQIIKVDKDSKGWYIDTGSIDDVDIAFKSNSKSFCDYCLSNGQKMDKQKGFLIEDIGIYFRWRSHSGRLLIGFAPNLESTEGLPEHLDVLWLVYSCQKSQNFIIRNKIMGVVVEHDTELIKNLKISGKCEDVLVFPNINSVTVSNGIKLYQPKDWKEFSEWQRKLGF